MSGLLDDRRYVSHKQQMRRLEPGLETPRAVRDFVELESQSHSYSSHTEFGDRAIGPCKHCSSCPYPRENTSKAVGFTTFFRKTLAHLLETRLNPRACPFFPVANTRRNRWHYVADPVTKTLSIPVFQFNQLKKSREGTIRKYRHRHNQSNLQLPSNTRSSKTNLNRLALGECLSTHMNSSNHQLELEPQFMARLGTNHQIELELELLARLGMDHQFEPEPPLARLGTDPSLRSQLVLTFSKTKIRRVTPTLNINRRRTNKLRTRRPAQGHHRRHRRHRKHTLRGLPTPRSSFYASARTSPPLILHEGIAHELADHG